jgi:hypothetical protein
VKKCEKRKMELIFFFFDKWPRHYTYRPW